MIVVKVGGSLFDHPSLGPGLREWVRSHYPETVVLVPGGGAFADAVRALDRVHRLGEEAAHWLAVAAMWTPMAFLRELLPGAVYLAHPAEEAFHTPDTVRILDADMFCRFHCHVPRRWDVTSDSIAAYAAVVGKARLVLLKSVDLPPDTPWEEAAARGWVDPHFPSVVSTYGLTVEAVNFRRRLDERGDAPAPADV